MADDLIETAPGANTAPPVLLLQGTGGTNTEMLNFGRRLAPQSPLITIAGRCGTGAERQYYRQTAAGPVDAEQVAAAAQWLGTEVTRICRQHRWAIDELVTVGYSNGAAMAAYGIRTGDLPGQRALLFHPLWLAVPQRVQRQNYLAWLSAGQRDPLVTVDTVAQVAADCEKSGVHTTLFQTGGSHMLTPQEVAAAKDWLSENN